MGFISELRSANQPPSGGFVRGLKAGMPSYLPGAERSKETWQEIFGRNNEDRLRRPVSRPTPGGSYGRSAVSSDASFMRLLQAMRSMAPGGWSDDRYEQSRHFYGIVYSCIHRTCEQLRQAEFQVYKKDPRHQGGKRPVEDGEPEYALVKLLEKPNPDDDFGEMLYRVNQQMGLTGKGLIWMVPNRLGTPMELYSIPTAIAIPQPAINPDYPDGFYRIQPVYPYGPFSSYPTPTTAVGAPIPSQWMLDIKYPHPILRYDGYSPLTALRLHVDEVEMMDRSRHYKMRRASNPDVVLNPDGSEPLQPLPQSEIDRIHAEWANEFQGPENHGKLIVGTPGWRFDSWGGPTPVEMDYAQSWDQLTSFIMGAGFGITRPVAGMIEDSSYATLFASLKQFHLLTLEPLCSRIASKLTRHLAPFFGDDLIIEIRCQRIDDHDVRNAKIAIAVQSLCMTKNEVRMELGLPVTSEPWGQEIAGIPSAPPSMPGMEQGMGVEQGVDPAMLGLDEEEMLSAGLGGEEEAMAGAPGPGNLGKGSLGPRKHLRNGRAKRLVLNGEHKK